MSQMVRVQAFRPSRQASESGSNIKKRHYGIPVKVYPVTSVSSVVKILVGMEI